MSILDSIAESAGGILTKGVEWGLAYRQQELEASTNQARAEAERLAAQAELERQNASKDNVYKFAKVAFFAAMALAGLAVLNEARKLWKGR